MADTVFTSALRQAAELQGSTQGLAYALRVPEGTLVRWMSGRAQMPVRAVHELVRLLAEHERRTTPAASKPHLAPERVNYNAGPIQARCPGCSGVDFLAAGPASELRVTSPLRCLGCNETTTHGDLLRALATASATPPRVARSARTRPPQPSGTREQAEG